jgi:hypothetical protein
LLKKKNVILIRSKIFRNDDFFQEKYRSGREGEQNKKSKKNTCPSERNPALQAY